MQTNFLVTTRALADGQSYSSKIQGALKHGVPIVDVAFVHACVEANAQVSCLPFLLASEQAKSMSSACPRLTMITECFGGASCQYIMY